MKKPSKLDRARRIAANCASLSIRPPKWVKDMLAKQASLRIVAEDILAYNQARTDGLLGLEQEAL